MKRPVLFISILLCVVSAFAKAPQTREKLPVFARSTWNVMDAMDETPGYDRSMHHEQQTLLVPANWSRGSVTFVSLGANQEVWLRVNGQAAGYHCGGYTAFAFDITSLLRFGENNLIEADITNAYNEDIPPLSADFTFFGGLYRDCYLQYTPKTHISTTFYATNGVIIETPQVNEEQAVVKLTTHLAGTALDKYHVEHFLNGNLCKGVSERMDSLDIQTITIANPQLWSPDNPTLYTLTTRLLKGNRIVDEVEQEIGLRYYRFNEQGLFELNGKVTRLIGTNRHQCYDNMGWAIPDSIHRLDIQRIKDMGGNFLRVSHYPQDPLVMHLCDSLGIITSVEVPIVNAITESEAFTKNSLNMLDEMVWQNRNHPSVVMWGYMNEILLRPPFKYQKGMWKRHWEYVMNVNKLASALNDRLHTLDSERYTFAAIHDYLPEYHECGLDTLADVIGHNIYSGWYSNTIESLDAKVDRLRTALNNRPMLMSEYGADCDSRLRTYEPQKFDYTLDYAMCYHRHYLHLLLTTDKLAGGTAWNLNDFYSESRGGAIPHLNLKGLCSISHQPKATYYFYQTQLLTDSVARAEAEKHLTEALQIPTPQEWPLCVMMGTRRYYLADDGLVWQPDQPYTEGSWGYIGGEPYIRATQHGPLPASDVTVLGTTEWPRYQTARMGISTFRVDVSNGTYRITLSLCELETIGEQEMSPYNLGNKVLDTGFTGRQMSIAINGDLVADALRLDTYRATDLTHTIEVTDGHINVVFTSIEGATILNAIKIEQVK